MEICNDSGVWNLEIIVSRYEYFILLAIEILCKRLFK